jgi:hypothetical protein
MGQLRVLPEPTICQIFAGELSQPQASSNSRTERGPPSEVIREPWNSTFKEGLNESRKAVLMFARWMQASGVPFAPSQPHE